MNGLLFLSQIEENSATGSDIHWLNCVGGGEKQTHVAVGIENFIRCEITEICVINWKHRSNLKWLVSASRFMTVVFFFCPIGRQIFGVSFALKWSFVLKHLWGQRKKFDTFQNALLAHFIWSLTIVGKLLLYKASLFRVPKALSNGLTYFNKLF